MPSPDRPVPPRYLSPVRVSQEDLDSGPVSPGEQKVAVSNSRSTRRQRSSSPLSPTARRRSRSPSACRRPANESSRSSHGHEVKRQRVDYASTIGGQASRPPRSPSPIPRSPPRVQKRAGSSRVVDAANPRDRPASPPPLPRSPPRQQKRPGASSRVAKPALDRSPTPPPRSPPRLQKRPGGGSRTVIPAQDATLSERRPERQPERAAESFSRSPSDLLPPRPGPGAAKTDHERVTDHYNSVQQYGVEWRVKQSNIKGLRSFNNWVKSCLINKFSYFPDQRNGLNVLDMGCGKGGDLQKWKSVRPSIRTYVGLDPAEISIDNARERFEQMVRKNRNRQPFNATFGVKDCFGESISGMVAITRVGFDTNPDPRFSQGGFDIVSLMFCLHYSFESEAKARQMLANVAGCLKKGGRFIGVIPNSDVIREEISGRDGKGQHKEFGNSIYSVQFRDEIPKDGVFRPPYGWKYFYRLDEAVNDVPEYVVPFEAFRGLAEDYNLELQYERPFQQVWQEEKSHKELGLMAERMGVVNRNGRLNLTAEEEAAAFFYRAFCFYKV